MEVEARAGDFILSRTNAPLISLCMSFLAEGRRAIIQGRDIGSSLAVFVKKSKAKDVHALRTYVENWSNKECARLSAKGRDTQSVEDKAACIIAISDGADTVADHFADARSRDTSAAIEFVRSFVQSREQGGLFTFGHSHFILRT
jgi:hypothetical protein